VHAQIFTPPQTQGASIKVGADRITIMNIGGLITVYIVLVALSTIALLCEIAFKRKISALRRHVYRLVSVKKNGCLNHLWISCHALSSNITEILYRKPE
jgi:hypothetical protein